MEISNSSTINNVLKKGFRFFRLLVIIVLVTWLIKAFFFSVYFIPSGSMQPTLKQGDYVLVSKFPYNLRTPEYYPLTDILFPNSSIDGFGEVHRRDIVVFDLPLFSNELHSTKKDDYIKRVVGIPGDTIALFNNYYYLLKKDGLNNTSIKFSPSSVIRFSIPKKGVWIQLVDSTKRFWESILIRDGNNITYDASGGILINGSKRERYQVKQDYYFVQGDNTNFSNDSRYWGLVPKSNLIGRAELIVWPWLLSDL